MKKLLTALSLLSLSACAHLSSSPSSIKLFDSQTTDLKNWHQVGPGKFVIEHQLLKSEGGMGLLYYKKQKFGNVKIHVVYKVTYADTNSGIFVRIAHTPKSAWDAVHHGYEIQICDKGKDAFDDYHITGAVYTFAKANQLSTRAIGQWNDLDVVLNHEKITVFVNHVKASEYKTGDWSPKRGRYSDPKRGPRPEYGFLGIQNHDHDGSHKDSHVYFKEITVTPLS